MSKSDKQVDSRYEIGSGDKLNPEFKVYTYRGEEFKVPMTTVRALVAVRRLPHAVREAVEFWADMLHNPD